MQDDLSTMKDAIYNGMSRAEVLVQFPKTSRRYKPYTRKCFEIAAEKLARPFRELTVVVFLGDVSTADQLAITAFPNIFTIDSTRKFPFADYDGQNAILLGNFSPRKFSYDLLLPTLDGHRHRLDIPYSHTYARWTHVFITSFDHPSTWYSRETSQLKRRIDQIIQISSTTT